MDGSAGPQIAPSIGTSIVEIFGYPRGLKITISACLAFFLLMLLFSIALPWLEPPRPGKRLERVQAMCLAVFGSFALMSFWLLWRMRDRFYVADVGLTAFRPGRRRSLSLRWDQINRIVDSPIHQRLELHGQNDAGQPVVLKLDNQLVGSDRLRALVMAYTDWQRLCDDPGDPQQALALPLTIPRTTAFFVFVGLGQLIFLAMVGVSLWAGVWWASAFFLIMAFVNLAEWYALGVDHGELTIRYPLRNRVIQAQEVAKVEISSSRQAANAYSSVLIHLKSGKTVLLRGNKGGPLVLYRALQQAFPVR